MGNKFYKLELSDDSKSIQERNIYFACVDENGQVLSVMNKPGFELTDDRYLKEARLNVDMAFERGRKEGLSGVKSWMLSKENGARSDDIEVIEISSSDWIKTSAHLHKCDNIAIVCRTEKSMRKGKMESRKYEDFDDLTIEELQMAKEMFNQLVEPVNQGKYPRYEDFDEETIKELRMAKESISKLVEAANKNEFPEHKITEKEVYNVIAYSILKDRLRH